MVTVGMNYVVLPGKGKAFESKFSHVTKALEEAPGHEQSNLYCDVKDEHSYLIVSQWTDAKAFDEFIASDAFKAVTNWGAEHILAGRPKHEVYGS